jgi:hypothetical protein
MVRVPTRFAQNEFNRAAGRCMERRKPQKFNPIIWKIGYQLVFERLKKALTQAPVLHQSEPEIPFTIETDVSDFAIGYSLLQVIEEDTQLHPVVFSDRNSEM